MPWWLGNSYWCFREACCPNLQGLSSLETFALVTLFQGLENLIMGTLLHASRLLPNHALSFPHALHSRKYFSHLFSSSTHLPLSFFLDCFGPMSCASTISNSVTHTYSHFLSSSPYIYPDSPTKLTLLPWRWKQKVSLKRWHISTRTHGLTFQNLEFFITCYSSRNNSKKLEALSRMHKAYFTPHATLSWLFYILLVHYLFFKDTVSTHIKCSGYILQVLHQHHVCDSHLRQ